MAASAQCIVTLSIASRDDVTRRALAAFDGIDQGSQISFASLDLLWQTLTPRRWEIRRAMAGQASLSVNEVARRVQREVMAVQGDVQALLDAGVLAQGPDGGVVFPFDAVHVDFTLTAAA